MKSFRLVCFFFLVILLSKVSGLPRWDLLEAIANRNVTNLDPNLEAITGIDDGVYQMWLFAYNYYGPNNRSSSPDSIDIDFLNQYVENKEYVVNKIDMVGSILFGPEKGHSTLRLASAYDVFDSQCVYSSMRLFGQHCGFLSEPAVKHIEPFINMCNHVGEEDKASIKEAIIAACGNNKSYGAVVIVMNLTTEVISAPIHGSSDYCERVFVNSVSGNILGSFAKIYHLLFFPFWISRDRNNGNAQICIHGDASLGLCQCHKDDWRPLSNKMWWSFVMSPYENKIVDVKLTSGIDNGSVGISLYEESQVWRYFFLAMGTALLFLAPSCVCKYILSRDADDMAGLFIKWVMRATAVACIFKSSIDTSVGMVAVVTCLTLYCVKSFIKK